MTMPVGLLLPLLEGLRASNRDEDWASLIAATHATLRVVCAQRLSGDLLVEDAVQETILRCRDGLAGAQWPDEASAWGWLRRIAANTALNLAASERARRVRERHVAIGRNEISPDEGDPFIDEELRALLLRHVAELSERQRLALELRFLHGLDVRTAAKRLGLSEVNFRALAHRALTSLRERLGGRAGAAPLVLLLALGFGRDAAAAVASTATAAGGASKPVLLGAAVLTLAAVAGGLWWQILPTAAPATATSIVADPPRDDRYAAHLAEFRRDHPQAQSVALRPQDGWTATGNGRWGMDADGLVADLVPRPSDARSRAWLIHAAGIDTSGGAALLALEFEHRPDLTYRYLIGLLDRRQGGGWVGVFGAAAGADVLGGQAGGGEQVLASLGTTPQRVVMALRIDSGQLRLAIQDEVHERTLPITPTHAMHLFPYVVAETMGVPLRLRPTRATLLIAPTR